jgi:DNA-binding MarR family transcriptional regulator
VTVAANPGHDRRAPVTLMAQTAATSKVTSGMASDAKTSKTTRADVRTTYLVKQLERAIHMRMDSMTRQFGLTPLQYTALTVLQRHPGMSSAQLARRSFVTAQAGNEMISVLTRKAFITRAPSEANRRILAVSLTAKGEEVLASCDERMDKLEVQMLGPLDGREACGQLRDCLASCVLALKNQRPPGE